MNINLALRNFGQNLDRNSPTILTALAVAGVVSSIFMAIGATPKANDLIQKEEAFRFEEYGNETPLTFLEKAEVTWKVYFPTAIMASVTIGCMVSANHISLRRNAAMASLLSLAETAAREYHDKVVETVGEKKEQAIRDEIAQERMNKHPIESSTVIITGKGKHLFFDSFSARYFESDIETIRQLVNDFNQKLIKSAPMFLPINDFYYELGLEPGEMGDEIGWNAEDNMLEVRTSSAKVTKDGRPCIILEYPIWPKHY